MTTNDDDARLTEQEQKLLGGAPADANVDPDHLLEGDDAVQGRGNATPAAVPGPEDEPEIQSGG